MEPITTLPIQLAILTQIIATPGALYNRTLILFQNNLTLTENTVLADLTECTFTNYAAVAAQAFGTPYIDPQGKARVDCPSVDFQLTPATLGNTVYGWALVDSGKTILVLAALLPGPVVLQNNLQGLSVQPTYAYGN